MPFNAGSNVLFKFSLCALVIILASGCGERRSPPKPATVKGIISLAGQPLKAGYIQFLSQTTSDVGASPIKEDGSYEVEGLSVGDYVVQIGPPVVAPGSPRPKTTQTIPQKYHSPGTSGLATTLQNGINKFDVSLQ